jgi:hypothetical protein
VDAAAALEPEPAEDDDIAVLAAAADPEEPE